MTLIHYDEEGPSQSGQFQGLLEAIFFVYLLLRSFPEGWNFFNLKGTYSTAATFFVVSQWGDIGFQAL